MGETRAEPPKSLGDPKAILLAQLAFYRATVLAKLDGLDDGQLRRAALPSGWSPLELLNHLLHVERRWMEWGFAGLPVPSPWADHDPATGRWMLAPGDTLTDLEARLAEVAARTTELAEPARLEDRARTGGRFEADPPSLAWILAHLLQEYARHAGHLDVVRELMDGAVGE